MLETPRWACFSVCCCRKCSLNCWIPIVSVVFFISASAFFCKSAVAAMAGRPTEPNSLWNGAHNIQDVSTMTHTRAERASQSWRQMHLRS